MVSLTKSQNDIITTDKGQYKKPSISNQIAGGILGVTGYRFVEEGFNILTREANLVDFSKYNKPEYVDAFDKAYEQSGLKEKGVQIVNVTKENFEDVKKISFESFPKIIKKMYHKNKFVKDVIDRSQDVMLNAVKDGQNALSLRNNYILINKEKLTLAGFHEMGHALNQHSIIGNILQKGRSLRLLTPLIAGTVLLTRKKADGEKPKNKFDKAVTFVRNHAISLTALSFLPLMLEEGSASTRGINMAKKFLSKDLTRQLFNTQNLAYLSYTKSFYRSVLAITAACAIKNVLSTPKKIDDKAGNKTSKIN